MTATVHQFMSHADIAAAEAAERARGKIVVAKTLIPGMRWKRRRWVVITNVLDGSSEFRDGMKDEGTALFVAGVFAKKYGFPVVNLVVLK